MKNIVLMVQNRAKLEKMIQQGDAYEKILQQSQKLDQYIMSVIKEREQYKEKSNM